MKTLLFVLALGLFIPAGPAISGEKHGSHAQQSRKKRVMQGAPAPIEEEGKKQDRVIRERAPGQQLERAQRGDRKIRREARPGHGLARLLREPKERSLIRVPDKGFGGERLKHSPFPARKFHGPQIRKHMSLVAGTPMMKAVLKLNASETEPGRYYWHRGSGFDYCHYYDPWGYHWYGWYFGSHYFWTRYHLRRWWWYDPDFGRWCFWWGGYWYWWDPFHAGLVYVYNDGQYVEAAGELYRSDDGSRVVKVIGKENDAFLYDGGKEPAFDPIFLATGVTRVKFIETSSGKVAEVKLTLGDGSTRIFTDEGEEIEQRP